MRPEFTHPRPQDLTSKLGAKGRSPKRPQGGTKQTNIPKTLLSRLLFLPFIPAFYSCLLFLPVILASHS